MTILNVRIFGLDPFFSNEKQQLNGEKLKCTFPASVVCIHSLRLRQTHDAVSGLNLEVIYNIVSRASPTPKISASPVPAIAVHSTSFLS